MLTSLPQLDLLFAMKSKEEIIYDYLKIYNKLEDAFRHIEDLDDENQKLKDRIAELEKRPKKPKLKGKRKSNDKDSRGKVCDDAKAKRGKSAKLKNKESLEIHNTEILQPKVIPENAVFKGYKDFIVQDIQLSSVNTLYRRAVYSLPNGKLISGELPESVKKSHYGVALKSYILNEYYTKRVTEDLIFEHLSELGIVISRAEISNILSKKTKVFEDDYDAIIHSAVKYSRYLHVDDTGSLHNGQNGYCTVLCNEAFAWYKSTDSKSKINFLEIISSPIKLYILNSDAHDYLKSYKIELPDKNDLIFSSKEELKSYLEGINVNSKFRQRIIEEAGLIGAIGRFKILSRICLMSDNAKQFQVFRHMQCYVHAERNIKKYKPTYHVFIDEQKRVLNIIWEVYEKIKRYKLNQTFQNKKEAFEKFEELSSFNIQYEHLRKQVDFILVHKFEYLMPLYDPVLPLHNNICENDVRQYVMKRNISGETKSESGQKARDMFLSLKITCRKCKVNFVEYLKARLGKNHDIPKMADIVKNRIIQLGIEDNRMTFAL